MQTVELRNYFILAKSSNTIGPKTQIIDDALSSFNYKEKAT